MIIKNVQFKEDARANVYCRYCGSWGNLSDDLQELTLRNEPCENCSKVGCLILNPFPDNLIPVVVLDLQDIVDAQL